MWEIIKLLQFQKYNRFFKSVRKLLKKAQFGKQMSGNKTMYMIFEKIIMYSKQIRESDKNDHEILENIEKTQKNCKFVVDEICF